MVETNAESPFGNVRAALRSSHLGLDRKAKRPSLRIERIPAVGDIVAFVQNDDEGEVTLQLTVGYHSV